MDTFKTVVTAMLLAHAGQRQIAAALAASPDPLLPVKLSDGPTAPGQPLLPTMRRAAP